MEKHDEYYAEYKSKNPDYNFYTVIVNPSENPIAIAQPLRGRGMDGDWLFNSHNGYCGNFQIKLQNKQTQTEELLKDEVYTIMECPSNNFRDKLFMLEVNNDPQDTVLCKIYSGCKKLLDYQLIPNEEAVDYCYDTHGVKLFFVCGAKFPDQNKRNFSFITPKNDVAATSLSDISPILTFQEKGQVSKYSYYLSQIQLEGGEVLTILTDSNFNIIKFNADIYFTKDFFAVFENNVSLPLPLEAIYKRKPGETLTPKKIAEIYESSIAEK